MVEVKRPKSQQTLEESLNRSDNNDSDGSWLLLPTSVRSKETYNFRICLRFVWECTLTKMDLFTAILEEVFGAVLGETYHSVFHQESPQVLLKYN